MGTDDSVSLAYQAGIMIKGHGQYEGGGWPEMAAKGSRLLGFHPDFSPHFSVGRKVPIKISYTNPEGRAELKVLWKSRIIDPQRIDPAFLYPGS